MVWCSLWYGAMYGMVHVWYGAVWYGAVCGMVYDKVYSIPDKLKFFRVMLNLFSKPGKLCFSLNSFCFF